MTVPGGWRCPAAHTVTAANNVTITRTRKTPVPTHLPSPAENPQGNQLDELRQDPEYADRHPIYGLPPRLLLDGRLFTYDPRLDHWTDGLGVEWSGWTILHGMSTTLRAEVAS